jgi:glycosyltransferase involved in cell wall biosynthesis
LNKLKIAFLSCGSFAHISPFLDFFNQRGHEVCLFAYDKPTKDYGVPVVDISFGARGSAVSSKWKYLLAGMALRKHLKKFEPDILHGHYVTSSGVVSLLSGFKPLVLTAHGSDLIASERSFVWRKILKAALSRAELVNVVSDQLELIAKKLGVTENKIYKATFGVDIKKFNYETFSSLSSPPKLLCARGLAKVYDPLTIVNACKILKQKNIDFTLTFAASGLMESEVRQVVKDYGLENHITFLGGFDNDKLPELLHAHDVYISATHWDGTSISLLETMACGTFPIVSRIKSNLSWLKEDKTCFMFECQDHEELAEKIQLCCADPELVRSATKLNRSMVEQKGSRELNMSILEQKYYEILS